MADSGILARARAHVERLSDYLEIWQPESLRGKHVHGMPYYGLLGVNLADFIFHETTSGRPLGDVTTDALVS
eukprot:11805043-Alexandrium_andersonii.AAC.1